MSHYRRNKFRSDVIERFGQTADLPLFDRDSRPIPEPVKTRFEGAPKAIEVATDTRNLSHATLTNDTVKFTSKQLAVLETIRLIGPVSNEEIAHHLGWPINRVVGRTFELRELGDVVKAGKRKCRITGNIVHTWRIK